MNSETLAQIEQFALIYLLLLVTMAIMRIARIHQSKTLVVASMKMTVQLVLAGLILTYIFDNPHPAFTLGYMLVMIVFSIHRVLSQNKSLNRRFKWVITLSMACSGVFIIFYYVCVAVGESFFNPQYVIPISGMVMGNTMTGVSLGVKTFRESLDGERAKINALLCFGAAPNTILLPFVRQAMETAMLPTINSMVGMGIVSLPGMMTGQILAGAVPTTAILYQIAIMIAICTVVCCACFGSLYFGSRTLYDNDTQIL